MTGWSVVVAGELITDHLFVAGAEGGSVYAGVRGGGSAFNVGACLADSAGHGEVLVSAWGSGGDDAAGRLAVADLDAAGVSTSGLALMRRRRTRLIFERIGHGPSGTVGGAAHGFGTACPVCGQRDAPRARPTLDSAAAALLPPAEADVLVLDRLSPARLRLAHALRARGTVTVLDLGAVDYLRYSPVVEILRDVGGVDLLMVSELVERSLLARAGLATPSQLADLADVGLLVVTRGSSGLTLVGGPRENRGHVHVPAAAVPVADDAGAGDTLLSGILLAAIRRAARAGRPTATMFSALGLHEAAQLAQDAVQPLRGALGALGARGHLTYRPPSSGWAQLVGRDTDRLLERAHALGSCPVCLLPIRLDPDATGGGSTTPTIPGVDAAPVAAPPPTPTTRARRKPGSARTVDLLLSRVLYAAEQEEPARQAADLLSRSGNGYVVGSGGSYTAATYLAELTRQSEAGPFLAATRPADFLRTKRPVDVLVAVSYSGGTSDLGHVLDHAARIGVGRLVLLTAARRPRLASRLRPLSEDMVVKYGPAGDGTRAGLRERGFVSIAATVMPLVPFIRTFTGLPDLVDLAERLRGSSPEVEAAHEIARHHAARELLLIGGGWATPALTDIEGKFAEADLGPTRIDEPKDFSHGRFISVLGAGPRDRPKQPVLMLNAGNPTRYEQTLCDLLEQDGHGVALIRSAHDGPLGGLELLCRVQRFSQQYGEVRGIDISRPDPPPPESGLSLYRSKASPS